MVVWCGLLIGFTLAVDVNNRPSLKRATSRFGLIAKQNGRLGMAVERITGRSAGAKDGAWRYRSSGPAAVRLARLAGSVPSPVRRHRPSRERNGARRFPQEPRSI